MTNSNDPRRLFTPAQRRALYWAANGKCEECGAELDPKNWHADHDRPHSKGGSTDVTNGRALCPRCNLTKGATMRSPYAELYLNPWPKSPPLRRWQDRFLERWLLLCDPTAGGQKDFLMAVVPAAGKTTASLKAAHEGLTRGWFEKIVIIDQTVQEQVPAYRSTARGNNVTPFKKAKGNSLRRSLRILRGLSETDSASRKLLRA